MSSINCSIKKNKTRLRFFFIDRAQHVCPRGGEGNSCTDMRRCRSKQLSLRHCRTDQFFHNPNCKSELKHFLRSKIYLVGGWMDGWVILKIGFDKKNCFLKRNKILPQAVYPLLTSLMIVFMTIWCLVDVAYQRAAKRSRRQNRQVAAKPFTCHHQK